MTRIAAAAVVLAALLAGPAVAQTGSSDTDIRGGGIPRLDEKVPDDRPDSTGSIAETGQRKPPGSALGEGMGTNPELERKSREIDRRIRTGICRGC